MPKDRDLYFTKQVTQESIATLTKEVIEINKDDRLLEKLFPVYGIDYTPKPIKIYIDSYGGQVYQCFGLLAIMESSITPLHTIVTGAAMSCGFMMAIHGHKRLAYKNATLMYHQVSSFAFGKLKDMEEDVIEAKRLQAMIEEMTLDKTNITKERLEAVYKKKEDWFLSAKDALKHGVIDEIVK